MKKAIIFTVIFTAASTVAGAQQVFTFEMNGGNTTASTTSLGLDAEQEKLGEANLECFYDYRWVTDTEEDKSKDELMVLQVGDGISKFYSYRKMQVDSLVALVTSPDEIMSNPAKYSGGIDMVVLKNYPAGKTTFTDKLGRDWFIYEESSEPQQWTILDDTKTIEGYECRKAICNFRGRDYVAWFTPEIPVSEGPWKFSGLPGLILDVADTEGHYSFAIKGIRQVKEVPINFAGHNYQKVDRKKFLQIREKFETDPIGYLALTANVKVNVLNPDGSTNTDAAIPKSLKYEFQERDYK